MTLVLRLLCVLLAVKASLGVGSEFCGPGLFDCDNGLCISTSLVCDTSDQCGDNSDEANCGPNTCAPTLFRCGDGMCLTQSFVCDGEEDCSDGQDENGCDNSLPSCPAGSVKCADESFCLNYNRICDGTRECLDGGDEASCASGTCNSNVYTCGDGSCIAKSKRCDFTDDCDDDEENCAYFTDPKLEINGQTTEISLVEETAVTITCDMKVVDLSSISLVLTCDFGLSFSNAGVALSITSTAERSWNGNTCTCVATGFSMTKQSSITVHVLWPPIGLPQITVDNGIAVPNQGKYLTREGVSLSITCRLDGGSPPEKDMTITCGGVERNMLSGSEVTASLAVTADMLNMVCVCSATHASNLYGGSSSFTVDLASIADTLLAGPDGFRLFDLCPGESSNLTMFCGIKDDENNPNPNITLQGMFPDDLQPTRVDTEADGTVKYVFSFRPTEGKVYATKCLAVNPAFPDMTTERALQFVIQEPPRDAPRLIVTHRGSQLPMDNENQVDVPLDEPVEVRCLVEGGYPSVSQVVLNCGAATNTTDGTEASIPIPVERSTHLTSCSCSAVHVTGCYDKTTTISLAVVYPTKINTFTISAQAETLEIEAGTELYFDCIAEGLPPPTVSIKGQNSLQPVDIEASQLNFYTVTLQRTKAIMCNESDTYVCTSNNGVAVHQNITVLVTCAPELMALDPSTGAAQASSFLVRGDGYFRVTFLIVSRPVPVRYRLYRRQRQTGLVKRNTDAEGTEVDGENFIATFEETNVRYGQLVLQVFDPEVEQTNLYTLVVSNDVGSDLHILFDTNVVPDEPDDDDSNSLYVTGLIVAGVMAVVFLCVYILVSLYLIKKRKTARAPKVKDTRVEDRDVGLVYMDDYQLPQPSRFWRPQVS